MTENEMVGWHHQFNGHEFEQTQGDSEGQGSLACCSPPGHREADMILATEQRCLPFSVCLPVKVRMLHRPGNFEFSDVSQI